MRFILNISLYVVYYKFFEDVCIPVTWSLDIAVYKFASHVANSRVLFASSCDKPAVIKIHCLKLE